MFDNPCFDNHERVTCICDPESGLQAVIAIHSTALGPAGGGCRYWTYGSSESAISDALSLSRGMSYKNAMAGLDMGGGKAVILAPETPGDRRQMLEAFGRAVNNLQGDYVTAEDVGISVADMQIIATQTRYVSGLSTGTGAGGDPSPYTARGVRLGIQAAVHKKFGRDDLAGLSVAIQGLGGVGGNLARELAERGANLIVADINTSRVEEICDLYGAERAAPESVLLCEADIIAPCALGGVISDSVARKVRASIVAGGANNQLATPTTGRILHERGIVYAPDYVINAGGIIVVAAEYFGRNATDTVDASIELIYDRTKDVLERACHEGRPAGEVADEIAWRIISNARQDSSHAPAQ
nr:Glu/Leu/Phe/Val dehydrogenase dimerization domain-containing protein [uncultured Hyphomonas sp.]